MLRIVLSLITLFAPSDYSCTSYPYLEPSVVISACAPDWSTCFGLLIIQVISFPWDGSNDGITIYNDCNDNDSSQPNKVTDADCDGVLTIDDCDDTDPNTIYDMDCDGILATLDCDDNDPNFLDNRLDTTL